MQNILAYYGEWFFNRISEGYCTVPNPFNSNQLSIVDLTPENVDVIVFWTRNPSPVLKKLKILDDLGYKYYFQFTINNYPKMYEKSNPSLDLATDTFIKLSDKIGPGKVIWRYDPIIFTDDLTSDFHIENFDKIFSRLHNYTERIVISIVDNYNKTDRRLNKLNTNYKDDQLENPFLLKLLKYFVDLARNYNIEVQSCAEEKEFDFIGIKHGKCIDDQLINEEFGIDLNYKKDKTQRLACGCTQSKDIGMNNTCVMGCEYCYATISNHKAIENKKKHDPNFSSLIKHDLTADMKEKIEMFKQGNFVEDSQFNFEF